MIVFTHPIGSSRVHVFGLWRDVGVLRKIRKFCNGDCRMFPWPEQNKRLNWLLRRWLWGTAWSACTRARCGNRVARPVPPTTTVTTIVNRVQCGPGWQIPRAYTLTTININKFQRIKRPAQLPPRRPLASNRRRSCWLRPVAAARVLERPQRNWYPSHLLSAQHPWSSYHSPCPAS